MGLIAEQSHLTTIDPGFEQKRIATYPGMAHFANEGPPNATCRECALWTGCGVESGYYAEKGKFGGMLKPRPCLKYKQLMLGDPDPGVPHDARACKYFEPTENTPSITAK